jgi:hypothetical protein
VARLCRSGRRSTSNKNREKGLHALGRDQVGISTCTAASRNDRAKQEHKNWNGVVIFQRSKTMPGAKTRQGGKRRAPNTSGILTTNTPCLPGRKRVDRGGPVTTIHSEEAGKGTSDEDSEDEDDDVELVMTQLPNSSRNMVNTQIIRTNRSVQGMSVATKTNVGDEVSMLRDSSSSVQASWESKIEALVATRMKEMEANWMGRPSDVASVVSAPVNDDFLKENLRKFVAERVFPKFKFIFKQKILEQVVEMALTNGFITKPDGFTVQGMHKYYSKVVKQCLDACRANAQSVARKKYLGKYTQCR